MGAESRLAAEVGNIVKIHRRSPEASYLIYTGSPCALFAFRAAGFHSHRSAVLIRLPTKQSYSPTDARHSHRKRDPINESRHHGEEKDR
jgi:hypothetical protein